MGQKGLTDNLEVLVKTKNIHQHFKNSQKVSKKNLEFIEFNIKSAEKVLNKMF